MSGPLGLDPGDIAGAIAAVRPGRTDDDPEAVFARGAWSGLAEPGDGVAGALIAALGPSDALRAVSGGRATVDSRELREGFARWRPRLDPAAALRSFRNAARCGMRLLVPGDEDWPAAVDDLRAHAPIALWALMPGERLPDVERSVALVGARAASDYGERIATEAGCGLAERGFAVVSGAAYGIDGTAHRSALASGGLTVAVLAGGLDRFYPSGHADLLQRIAREGAVLSELPCGATPTRWRFLQRNRVIAALARATVVLEAGTRSGSLNTAGHASALGRPIGAVPGSVFSASSAGCHRLLREYDAIAVRNVADMAELARDPDDAVELDLTEPAADPTEQRVLDALARTARPVLDVARRSGLAPADVMSALGLLELTGAVQQQEGGWVRRPSPGRTGAGRTDVSRPR